MANKNIVKGNIGNALHSVAPDHIVTTSDEVFDETLQMYQNKINFLDGVFDISAYNLTDGQPTKYADLAAALGINGANVPESYRRDGMTVKYVQSSSNKYVQYRLMSNSFSTSIFDWKEVAGLSNIFTEIGHFVKRNGYLGTHQDYTCTGYIPIVAGETYLAKVYQGSEVTPYYIYDKDTHLLGYVVEETDGVHEIVIDSDTILSQYPTAAYIRLSGSIISNPYVQNVSIGNAIKAITNSLKRENPLNSVINVNLLEGKDYNSTFTLATAIAAVPAEMRYVCKAIIYRASDYAHFAFFTALSYNSGWDSVGNWCDINTGIADGLINVNSLFARNSITTYYTLETATQAVKDAGLNTLGKMLMYRTAEKEWEVAIWRATSYGSEFTIRYNWSVYSTNNIERMKLFMSGFYYKNCGIGNNGYIIRFIRHFE